MRPPPPEVPTLTHVVGFGADEPATAMAPAPDPHAGVGVAGPVDGAEVEPVQPASARPVPSQAALPDRAVTGLDAPLPGVADLAAAKIGRVDLYTIDEDELAQRVLVEVQKQVDRMFEFRVKEAVGPAFARLLEGFIEATRDDLESTLRDIVRRAVAQELSRHRAR